MALGHRHSRAAHDSGWGFRSLSWSANHSWSLGRNDSLLPGSFCRGTHPGSQRPVADYFVQQMYVTPSGMFTLPPFLLAMQVVGAERILYSVDYPFHFQEAGQARAFLENAPISPADKEKIAHSNAEGLLKLSSLYHSDVSK
jgi:predicted TIM-barrel fold metal-dependent hydrolase